MDIFKYDKIWYFGYETARHFFTILTDFSQFYLLDKKEGLLLKSFSLLELLNVVIEGYIAVPLNTQVLWILDHGECQVFSNLSENRNA